MDRPKLKTPTGSFNDLNAFISEIEKYATQLEVANEVLIKLIKMFDEDMYSASGKISKKTAIQLIKHAGRFQ